MLLRFLLLAFLGCLLSGRSPAATYEVVGEFERPGTVPLARVVYVPAAAAYFGTTNGGGAYGLGTIFKLTPAGVRTTLVSFSGTGGPAPGAEPDAGLVLAPDGQLYGTTPKGGAGDFGTLFRVSTTGAFASLVQFTGETGARPGSAPNELLYSGGYFYGTAQGGGLTNNGTVFRYTPGLLGLLERFDTLKEFTGITGALRGTLPVGALTVDATGRTFYGVTQMGGSDDLGTAYKVVVNDPLGIGVGMTVETATLVNFRTNGSWGIYPAAGLLLVNSALYGTTQFGGNEDAGTLYKISVATSTPVLSIIYHFNDLEGACPAAALVLGPDGLIYGTTSAGGGEGAGTIFRLTLGGQPSNLQHFTGDEGAVPGDFCNAAMIVGADGALIGTTAAGGAGGNGVVFRLTTAGAYSVVGAFANPQGWQPAGVPAFTDAGAIFLPMAAGGEHSAGTVVKIDGGVASLSAAFGTTFGREPAGGLHWNGVEFYGAAEEGGNNGRGAIYRISPAGSPALVASPSQGGGATPEGPLVRGADGMFYVAAREGGANGKGALLRVHPAGGWVRILSFTGTAGAAPGEKPRGPLALDAQGNVYGVTEKGGAENKGVVFKYDPGSGACTVLHQFTAAGAHTPLSGLTAGGDGALYGTTALGGASNKGTVFQIDANGGFTIRAEFTGANGEHPAGTLLRALDGTWYGVTTEGGANGFGTIFRVKTGGLETLFHFTGVAGAAPGAAPVGGLVMGGDGLIYGCTEEGGPRGGGVVFRVKNLGPTVVTDPVTYGGLIATVNGRAFTGGLSTSVWFEVALLPELLPLSITLPAQTSTADGVITYSLPVPNLLLGQLIHVRACAQNSEGLVRGATRTLVPLAPLQAWKAEVLGDANAPDLDDPDLDGSVTLAEYALCSLPQIPDAVARPAPLLKDYAEGKRLAILVRRDPARNDVTIDIQAASSVLGPWTTVASSVKGAPFAGAGYVGGDGNTGGMKTVEIRDVPPVGAAARFLRVIVTR